MFRNHLFYPLNYGTNHVDVSIFTIQPLLKLEANQASRAAKLTKNPT
jgi:hypothetical protein